MVPADSVIGEPVYLSLLAVRSRAVNVYAAAESVVNRVIEMAVRVEKVLLVVDDVVISACLKYFCCPGLRILLAYCLYVWGC